MLHWSLSFLAGNNGQMKPCSCNMPKDKQGTNHKYAVCKSLKIWRLFELSPPGSFTRQCRVGKTEPDAEGITLDTLLVEAASFLIYNERP